MKYNSTRSNISCDSLNAVLSGLAPDGGLYISKDILNSGFDWKKCLSLNTEEKASMILSFLLPDFKDMEELVRRAYKNKFETPDMTPVVSAGKFEVLELFRGPTSAFKDVALSMLPVLITSAKQQTENTEKTVILTATSGDTGKAALEGFHDVEGTSIIVFYPHGGVSPVQKAQMATQKGGNVTVCAVKGNFDDCQNAVKKVFREISNSFVLDSSNCRLSSANSINIGRLAPQVTYYFTAYSRLLEKKKITLGDSIDFVVPTGNFGDILAGYFAKLMGLPVGKLICASNANNVLTDFINTGIYDKNRPFYKTQSPSMDILISSNLERLLYLACGCDCNKTASWMENLAKTGKFTVDSETLKNIQNVFLSYSCNEEETQSEISCCWKDYSYLCDPHTAVAFHAAKLHEKDEDHNPMVILSTASPYKFPKAVLKAIEPLSDIQNEFRMMERINMITGVKIPSNLSSLESAEEIHKDVIEASDIMTYVLNKMGVRK